MGEVKNKINDVLNIQCSDGNWNYDPYMHGLANGLILAKAIIDEAEPHYLSAPETWIKDIPKNIKE